MTARVIGVLTAKFGEANVMVKQPGTGAEDFSRYGRTDEKIPIFMFNVGAVNRAVYLQAQKDNTVLPSLHSSSWSPEPEPTIKTAVTAFITAALDLMKK